MYTNPAREGARPRDSLLDGAGPVYPFLVPQRSQNKKCHSRVVEPKRRLGLVDRDLARDLGDVAVERAADVVVVAEDERLLEAEADGDDVARVALRELVRLLGLELVLEQELFVV